MKKTGRVIKMIVCVLIMLIQFQKSYAQTSRENAIQIDTSGVYTVTNFEDGYWMKIVAVTKCNLKVYTIDSTLNNTELCYYNGKDEEDYYCDEGGYYGKYYFSVWKELDSGDVLYIKYSSFFNKDSSFRLKILINDNKPGVYYSNPLYILADSTQIIVPDFFEYGQDVYYEYVAKETAYIGINRSPYPDYYPNMLFVITDSLDNDRYYEFYFNDSIFLVLKGERYHFIIDPTAIKDFVWSLYKINVDIGTSSQYPIPLVDTGLYEVDNSKMSQWYTIINNGSCYYQISTENLTTEDTKFEVFNYQLYDSTTLDNINDSIKQSVFIGYNVPNGNLIKISNEKNQANYFLRYTKLPQTTGDNESLAIPVYVDSVYSQKMMLKYYRFIVPKDGPYRVSKSDYNVMIRSNNARYDHEGIFFPMRVLDYYFKGDTIYISIDRSDCESEISWMIEEYIPNTGEECSVPQKIESTGTFKFNNTIGNYWIKFISPKYGKCTFKNCQNESIRMSLYSKCSHGFICNNATETEYGTLYDNTLSYNVSKGDTLYLRLYRYYSIEFFQIEISIEEIADVDLCLNSESIDFNGSKYYSSSIPENESKFYSFLISEDVECIIDDRDDVGDNYVLIYKDCKQKLTTSDNGKLSVTLSPGEYQIQWLNTSGKDINWSITLNDSPDTDKDGKLNTVDEDDDNDEVLDINDAFPYDASETTDTDKDGIGDNADTDDDNDGILDIYDPYPFGNVSIAEIGKLHGIKVSPNPADDRIQIMGIESGTNVSLKIVDSKGTVVFVKDAYVVGTSIDVSSFENSTYLVIINNNGILKTSLFVKN